MEYHVIGLFQCENKLRKYEQLEQLLFVYILTDSMHHFCTLLLFINRFFFLRAISSADRTKCQILSFIIASCARFTYYIIRPVHMAPALRHKQRDTGEMERFGFTCESPF